MQATDFLFDPAVPPGRQRQVGFFLAPEVYGPDDARGDSLQDRFRAEPQRTFDAIAGPDEAQDDFIQLRTSMLTLVKLEPWVDGVLRGVYNLGKKSKIEVSCRGTKAPKWKEKGFRYTRATLKLTMVPQEWPEEKAEEEPGKKPVKKLQHPPE